MHPAVHACFDAICNRITISGRVLEIGAIPAPDTLLCLPSLEKASLRVGINRDGPHLFQDLPILKADASDLALFATGSFDAVLCNSVLEHDACFWRILAEIERVARPGALVAIGVPGYADPPAGPWRRPLGRLARAGLIPGRIRPWAEALLAGTPTLRIHNFPRDYYRFSAQAMRDVLLRGCRDVDVSIIMQPPRIIGFGFRA